MYNIEANPEVSVQVGSQDFPVRAQSLSEEEKEAVWPRLVKQLPNFDPYQDRSGRELRVFRMTIPSVEDTV